MLGNDKTPQKISNSIDEEATNFKEHEQSQNSNGHQMTFDEINDKMQCIQQEIAQKEQKLKKLSEQQSKTNQLDNHFTTILHQILEIKKSILTLEFQKEQNSILKQKVVIKQRQRRLEAEKIRKQQLKKIEQEKIEKKKAIQIRLQEADKEAKEKKEEVNQKFKYNKQNGSTYTSHNKVLNKSKREYRVNVDDQTYNQEQEEHQETHKNDQIYKLRQEARIVQIEKNLNDQRLKRSRRALVQAEARLRTSRMSYPPPRSSWPLYQSYY